MFDVRKVSRIASASATALLLSTTASAGILFHFTEGAGTVFMESSGIIDTEGLEVIAVDGWGGTGVEDNSPGEIDIMGGTGPGALDVTFRFNIGSDFSDMLNPGGPFSSDAFSWNVDAGTKSFATYARRDGLRVAGLGVVRADLDGSLWSPDQMWSRAGTFASLGLNAGTYVMTDSLTGETITILIGEGGGVDVPAPGALGLLGLGLLGMAVGRRRS